MNVVLCLHVYVEVWNMIRMIAHARLQMHANDC